MAVRYVYSGAAGAGTGADWANAHVSLSAAITASSAGDTFYVAHDHVCNYGVSTTLTFKGTRTNPDRVLSVNRAGSVPPVAADLLAGALEGTNASSASLTINGSFYVYGMTFAPGSGQSSSCHVTLASSFPYRQVHESCTYRLLSTGGGSLIRWENGSQNSLLIIKPRVKFSSTGHQIRLGTEVFVEGDPSVDFFEAGSSVPTTLFSTTGTTGGTVSGLDLSSITGNVSGGANSSGTAPIKFVGCRLHSSATLFPSTITYDGQVIEFYACSSGSNVRRDVRYTYMGNVSSETTVKRTGGASDGTTSYSSKLISNANATRDLPLKSFEGSVWNSSTGSSKTLTVHTVTDGVTLTDAECWLEVEYFGDASYPVSSFKTDQNATILTTAANQATSTESWTTTGLASPVKQKLEVTFTPQMNGLIRWRVCLAKASTTAYICPKAELS